MRHVFKATKLHRTEFLIIKTENLNSSYTRNEWNDIFRLWITNKTGMIYSCNFFCLKNEKWAGIKRNCSRFLP